MKKLVFALFCLLLLTTGCGKFNVQVQIVPSETVPATPSLAALTTATPTATPTSAPPTATVFVPPTLTPTPAERPITLAAIQMHDVSRGWGVESSGRILKTADGGGLWKDVTPPQGTFDRHSLFAFNSEAAWVVPAQLDASLNTVWRTQDGGITWKSGQPLSLEAGASYRPLGLQFPDAQHGWLLLWAQGSDQGSSVLLYKSDNDGEDWRPITVLNERLARSYLPATETAMAFLDDKTGWVGGWWGKNDPAQWVMLKTSDGGIKWGSDGLTLPEKKAAQCSGRSVLQMIPGAMAVDMICVTPKDPKYLYHHVYYLSSGTGWHSWAIHGDFLSAAFINVNVGWMIVDSDDPQLREILYTSDGGKEWQAINRVNWKEAQLQFVTDKQGWALIGNGFETALMRTGNGGRVWVQVRPFVVP